MANIVNSLTRIDLSELIFPMVVVYEKPLDYKDYYVARIFDVRNKVPVATDTIIVSKDLELIRKDIVAAGFDIKFNRADGDEPCILETWIR